MIRKPLFIFCVSMLVLVFSLGVCYGGVELLCAPGKNENIAIFTILFSGSVVLSNLLLLFFLDSYFVSWSRFAKYYLPIAALLVIIFPTTDSSILGFDKEFMSWFLSGLFLVISIIIILYKHFHKSE